MRTLILILFVAFPFFSFSQEEVEVKDTIGIEFKISLEKRDFVKITREWPGELRVSSYYSKGTNWVPTRCIPKDFYFEELKIQVKIINGSKIYTGFKIFDYYEVKDTTFFVYLTN